MDGIQEFGIPSRVGGDRGVENVNVARFMIDQKRFARKFSEITYKTTDVTPQVYVNSKHKYSKALGTFELTNREALTVFCSVVKHTGSGWSAKEV
ncbi:hypothetical protein pdam_00021243 [Pocillopora damicornis]|uniref:Uncharacterized protein n=1 Tax=Pocillopora damicornis TaxID=46731 RepID=A0A3M6UP00_POCDA|nr:hypothetical protein pdam_00021243 [Pocillopora damicornis]